MISMIIIKSDKNAENKPFLWFSSTRLINEKVDVELIAKEFVSTSDG